MPYQYERVVSPSSGLRLHLNENTRGCSPAVQRALQALTRTDAAFYPDYERAIEATARWLRVTPDRLLLTNGLDEGILALSIVALRGSTPGDAFEVVVVVPAFDMYAACADVVGGRVVEVPLGPGFAFEAARVLEAVTERTRLIWLTNPNNPTGRSIARDTLLDIAASAPGALVAVDEAYADFSGETLLDDGAVDRFRNIVVGRTFAKAHGLAALRAGALVAHPDTLEPLRRAVLPYSLNAAAAAALPAAFADREYFDWYLAQVAESKALLYDAFARLGVESWPSAANFVLARLGDRCAAAVPALAARGIYVRDKSNDPACGGCIRVTAGIVEDTQAFVAALEEVL
jgi:histidinol-phosphate aminotransferase